MARDGAGAVDDFKIHEVIATSKNEDSPDTRRVAFIPSSPLGDQKAGLLPQGRGPVPFASATLGSVKLEARGVSPAASLPSASTKTRAGGGGGAPGSHEEGGCRPSSGTVRTTGVPRAPPQGTADLVTCLSSPHELQF